MQLELAMFSQYKEKIQELERDLAAQSRRLECRALQVKIYPFFPFPSS